MTNLIVTACYCFVVFIPIYYSAVKTWLGLFAE